MEILIQRFEPVGLTAAARDVLLVIVQHGLGILDPPRRGVHRSKSGRHALDGFAQIEELQQLVASELDYTNTKPGGPHDQSPFQPLESFADRSPADSELACQSRF